MRPHAFVRPQPGAEGGRFAPNLALIVEPGSAGELKRALERANFRLDAVRDGAAVPRIYVAALPPDLPEIAQVDTRKRVFLRSVLPLVLLANEELRQRRARMLDIAARLQAGQDVSIADRAWLDALAEHYELAHGDLDALKRRVDAIPPSLALAQAIVESGWGTSRFALEGNALFGQRVWSNAALAMTPERNRSVRVQAFIDLMDSVRAYMHNLNTHPAYAALRAERARLTAAGETPGGHHLAHGLEDYAEIDGYVDKLFALMRHNALADLDAARLQSRGLTAFAPRR
jgi:Bax protein